MIFIVLFFILLLFLALFFMIADVILQVIICDRSSSQFCLSHHRAHWFFGCERCVQQGERIGGVMTFPNLCATLRDGNSFRSRRNKPHHNGVGPIEELKIDMVYGFGLDYMHLVCQGVMKRLLVLWRGKRKTTPSRAPRKWKKADNYTKDLMHRLPFDRQEIINKRITAASIFFPVEFQRKGRPLDDLEMWKAKRMRKRISPFPTLQRSSSSARNVEFR